DLVGAGAAEALGPEQLAAIEGDDEPVGEAAAGQALAGDGEGAREGAGGEHLTAGDGHVERGVGAVAAERTGPADLAVAVVEGGDEGVLALAAALQGEAAQLGLDGEGAGHGHHAVAE